MQKKKLGIWWNIKAEEMYHGWDAVVLEYEKQTPVQNSFINDNGYYITPCYLIANTGSSETGEILIHTDYASRILDAENMYNSFQFKYNAAYLNLPENAKLEIQTYNSSRGLYSYEDKYFDITYGPMQNHAYNKRSLHSKFFSRWFPTSILAVFSNRNGSIRLKDLKLDLDDHVRLVQGCVWGAVKYNGRWLGARIVKISD